MGLGSILDISLSGLFAASTQMQTASNNIANANVPGYSRQRVVTAVRPGLRTPYGLLGTGTAVTDVRRMTDQFLGGRLRAQTAAAATADAVDSALQEIETILGSVDNDHLGTAMTDFFNAWSDLATPPINGTLRQSVLNAAQRLVDDFHAMDDGLGRLAADLDTQLADSVSVLNGLLRNVADLNRQVLLGEAGGGEAGALRDSRDELLRQVAQLVRADVVERDDGTVDVIVGGRTLVSRDHAETVSVVREPGADGEPGLPHLAVHDGRDPLTAPAGKLAGLLAARREQVPAARQRLDAVAAALIERVNALHVEGMSGNRHGVPFFTGDDAHSIAVEERIVEDPDLIAVSRSGAAGDNDIALAIAGLGQATGRDGETSLKEMFTGVVMEFASRSAASRQQVESQRQLVEAVQNRLDSIRGVNLDEEAANLALYQNSFQAAAKVITTVQKLYDTVLTMV